MQTSRNSISNANNNFEFLKNNYMTSTKSSMGKSGSQMKLQTKSSRINSTRGSIHDETKRNPILPSGQYKTNLSGINKTSTVVRTGAIKRTGSGESDQGSIHQIIPRCGSGTNLRLKLALKNQQSLDSVEGQKPCARNLTSRLM
jgi:hypothetical protein